MAQIPTKFLLFVAAGGFFYVFGLPKRADFVNHLLRKARSENREENLKVLVEDKIRGEICSISDMCEYRPAGWREFQMEDSTSASVTHEFYADGVKKVFLFRMRYGAISEVIKLN